MTDHRLLYAFAIIAIVALVAYRYRHKPWAKRILELLGKEE